MTHRGSHRRSLYTRDMHTYDVPADMPQDPDEITVEWAADQMREVRNIRQTRNLTFPRFVRALNNAGYAIGIEDYKIIERAPKLSLPHVREGILTYVSKVLNATRVSGSVQDHATAHAMVVIGSARREKGLDFADVAIQLRNAGIDFSEASYRTAEQGIMRVVPFAVIAECVKILDLEPRDLFRD